MTDWEHLPSAITSLDSLPPELHHQIVSVLHSDSRRSGTSPIDMVSLSSCNRHWRKICLPFVFRDITLRVSRDSYLDYPYPDERVTQFIGANTKENCRLVRSLHLIFDHSPPIRSEWEYSPAAPVVPLASLFTRIFRLSSLVITFPTMGVHPIDCPTFRSALLALKCSSRNSEEVHGRDTEQETQHMLNSVVLTGLRTGFEGKEVSLLILLLLRIHSIRWACLFKGGSTNGGSTDIIRCTGSDHDQQHASEHHMMHLRSLGFTKAVESEDLERSMHERQPTIPHDTPALLTLICHRQPFMSINQLLRLSNKTLHNLIIFARASTVEEISWMSGHHHHQRIQLPHLSHLTFVYKDAVSESSFIFDAFVECFSQTPVQVLCLRLRGLRVDDLRKVVAHPEGGYASLGEIQLILEVGLNEKGRWNESDVDHAVAMSKQYGKRLHVTQVVIT